MRSREILLNRFRQFNYQLTDQYDINFFNNPTKKHFVFIPVNGTNYEIYYTSADTGFELDTFILQPLLPNILNNINLFLGVQGILKELANSIYMYIIENGIHPFLIIQETTNQQLVLDLVRS